MPVTVSDRILTALLRVFKVFAYVVSTVLIFLILAGVLTQTPYLKNLIRSYLVSTLSKSINGTLNIGRIEGNMISGFSMDSVSIDQGGREVIAIGKIVCLYEPLGLLRRNIDITSLVVDAPRLTLVRSAGGRWTMADLFNTGSDTASSAGGWKIRVENFLFRYGTLQVDDSTIAARGDRGPADAGSRIPSFPTVRKFTIGDARFEGSLSIAGGVYDLKISRMNWYSHDPDFELQALSGGFHIDPDRTVVSGLNIRSGRSSLMVDASIERSLLEGIPSLGALKEDSVTLHLDAPRVDYDELRTFLTYIPRTPGSASVTCEAAGPFGELRVSGLRVITTSSDVSVSGLVSQLHDPAELTLDVAITPSMVTMRDLDIFISQIPEDVLAPDLPVRISGRFVGRPLDFATDLELEGEFGYAAGHAAMHLTADPIAYSASYTLRKFNPGTLFGVGFDSTTLNGRVDLQGEGFTPEEMKTNFFMILDSSRFRGFPLGGLEATGTLTAGALDAEAHATSGRTVADATFDARFSGDTVSVRNADVSVRSLDLAAILNDSSFRSDITARGRLSFGASSLDDLNAEAALVLLPSRFRGHEVGADSVLFTLDQRDPAKKVFRVNSSLARVELGGGFDLKLLGPTISGRLSALTGAIREHTLRQPEDASARATERETRRTGTSGGKMDFTYRVSLDNLLPVGEFFNTAPFNMHGDISGRFVSDPDHLMFSLSGNLKECFVGTIASGSLLRNATIDLTLSTRGDSAILEHLTSDLAIRFESGIVGGRPVDNARANLSYSDSKGVIMASLRLDSAMDVRVGGQASIQPGAYIVDLDTLNFNTGGYSWHNDQDVQFRLSDEGLRVMHAVFRRGDEEISARGLLGDDGKLDAALKVERFDLSVLNTLLPYPELKTPGNGFLGSAGGDVTLGGSLSSPEFTVTATSENFILRKTRLGFVEARMTYSDRRLGVLIQTKLSKTDPNPILTVDGFMPANFSFTGSGERFPDREQNIRVHAASFDISIFDPLISELENLTGRVNSELLIGGTPLRPEYSGSMDFADVNFLFVPNNIPYIMNGTIMAEGSRLVLSGFSVENLPTARPSGRMELSGTITTDRFKLDSFDITGKGNLLAMAEETRRVMPSMYGPLFIRTDSNGLNLSGNLSRPFLRGNVFVTDAFITFPPKNRTQTLQGYRTLNYVVVNDTSAGYTTEELFLRPFFESGDSASATEAGGGRRGRPTFLDLLRYDLNVETRGTPSIRFIFSQLSDEVLYAELNGRVSLVNEQGEPRVYGQIEIGAPSYYKFYQRFDATGRLKFVGPWDNPELDIRATYEASHITYSDQNGEGEAVPRRVQVLLEITGRRYEPVLKMTLREQSTTSGTYVDLSGNSTPAETQSDAISFILTGKFSNELTSSDRSTIAGDVTPGTGAMVGSILTSSLLTGVLEDYIRQELPFIRSVDVTYEGGSSPGTNVQVSANALKGYLRIGGKILSDVGRASVSYKASLGDIFNATSIRNLFFEIEQRIETETQKNKNTVEGRIYYRFSF
jgi:hypothetical protein